jgi:DNA-directed RNA polymerase sigma subunit (sigma70/sigma32)
MTIEKGEIVSDEDVSKRIGVNVSELQDILESGEIARRTLIDCNLKFIVYVAKAFKGRGVPFTDLVMDGHVGLAKAVERYDPDKGFRFSTYAAWWISQGLTQTIAERYCDTLYILYLFGLCNCIA